MNKLFSILTFLFIIFGIFGIMYLIQISCDDLDIKKLDAIVEKEIKEYKNLKKHIDSH